MTFDAQTACPACPIVWRNLYAVDQVLLAFIDSAGPIDPVAVFEVIANLRLAMRHVQPIVDAHLENQDHAMSAELADARLAWRRPGD